eukprot:TRINITY_DN29457_c0_g1_i1.p1 TRINITY_DN29457_c0_g1~~TRINITY_DN29457_c0_g1_i1.p1  ORF type:complete len:886 (+),score=190.50 TRINITY_DN29457_c0_g1_i1:133-2790(+)
MADSSTSGPPANSDTREGEQTQTDRAGRSFSKSASSKVQFAAFGLMRKSAARDTSVTLPRSASHKGSTDEVDPHIEALMASLVDSSKMDVAWTKVNERILQLERRMEQLQFGQPDSARGSAFVTKKELNQFFEGQGNVGEGGVLSEIENKTNALGQKMTEKSATIKSLANKLQSLEEANAKSLEEALAAAQKAEDAHNSLAEQLKEAVKKTAISIAEANSEREKKEATMSQKIRDAWQSMKDLEVSLQHFARTEARKTTKELLFSESGLPMTPGGGSSRGASRDNNSRGAFAFGLVTPPSTASTAGGQRGVAAGTAPTVAAPAFARQTNCFAAAAHGQAMAAECDSIPGRTSTGAAMPMASAGAGGASPRETAFVVAAREGISGASCIGPAQWRAGLLTLVEQGLVEPLREEVLAFRKDMSRQKEDIDRMFRTVLKTTDDLGMKIMQNAKDIRSERDARMHEEIKAEETISEVYKAIAKAAETASAHHETVMSTCADLQTIADAHAEKLQLHAKDILDSATKNDAKRLGEGLAKSITKDTYKKEVAELKKIIDYHSDKLDSIGMQVSVLSSPGMSGKGHKDRTVKKQKNLKRDHQSVASRLSETASTGLASSEVSLQSLSESPEPQCEVARAAPQVGGPEDQEGFEDADEIVAKVETAQVPIPESPVLVVAAEVASAEEARPKQEEREDEEEAENEEDEDDDDSECSDSPGDIQLREQVQGVCAGLVCLGQHVLRGPPQCGLSRQNRLLQEKDLLEELLALRQWITQRHIPPGWSPDKLVSLALRYAHPSPHEAHGPQPEMSYVLNRQMAPTEAPLPAKAFPILEGSGSFAKSPRDRIAHKAPFSARGLKKTPSSERSVLAPLHSARDRMSSTLPPIGITPYTPR